MERDWCHTSVNFPKESGVSTARYDKIYDTLPVLYSEDTPGWVCVHFIRE